MLQENLERVLAEADDVIISAMNEEPLSGLGVGIVHGGRLIYARGFGLADSAANRPVTPDTVFRIGSISKTFTAVALMQLLEQGKLELDDPIRDYLKGYRVEHPDPYAPPITFRHLLTHTAGIGELRSLSDLLNFRHLFGLGAKPGEEVPPLPEFYGGRLSTELYPGSKWAYANHAFATLGQLVEDISGEPFAEYMIRHIFDPLGMEHSDFLRSGRVADQLAIGYQFRRGKMQPVDYLEIVVTGAGAAFSTVNDMGRYMVALLGGGVGKQGRVLKPETLKAMMQPQFRLDDHLPAMGLAFFLDRFDGHRVISHDGGWAGFVSSMYLAPDDGIGVVAFTNTSSVTPSRLAPKLVRRLLDLPDPASRLPAPVPESPHLWPELAGYYGPSRGINTNARTWLGFGGELQVFLKGGHLALRSLAGPLWKGVRLYPVDRQDPLVFNLVQEGFVQPVVFKRNAEGRVDRLLLGFGEMLKRSAAESIRVRASLGVGALVGTFAASLLARRARSH